MNDNKLVNYLIDNGYLNSYINGGITSLPEKPLEPILKNGKYLFNLTLDEFIEYEKLYLKQV